jgi:hypothetical protein
MIVGAHYDAVMYDTVAPVERACMRVICGRSFSDSKRNRVAEESLDCRAQVATLVVAGAVTGAGAGAGAT